MQPLSKSKKVGFQTEPPILASPRACLPPRVNAGSWNIGIPLTIKPLFDSGAGKILSVHTRQKITIQTRLSEFNSALLVASVLAQPQAHVAYFDPDTAQYGYVYIPVSRDWPCFSFPFGSLSPTTPFGGGSVSWDCSGVAKR